MCDNFLDTVDFNELVSIAKSVECGPVDKVFFSHKINKREILESTLFKEDFLKHLYWTYAPKLLNWLQLQRAWKAWFYDYADISLQLSGGLYQDKIHLDVPRKLISGVCYLQSGLTGVGTLLYNKFGSTESEIEVPWVDNRMMVFSRSESSYHSYRGNGRDVRVTLVYNLCSNRHRLIRILDKFQHAFGK